MRFASFEMAGIAGVAVQTGHVLRGLLSNDPDYPGDLADFVGLGTEGMQVLANVLGRGRALELEEVTFLPLLKRPPKIICVGLNYKAHTEESGFVQPSFPTFFGRFSTGLIGHGAPIIEPHNSASLDFEGELAVIVGKRGRRIPREQALNFVAGYSVFNDGSVREYQFKTPQWMIGKNFDNTGSFGPYFVTADEVPLGARGLKVETRLNNQIVQSSNTDLMVFDVASTIAHLSEAMTLEPGDVIVSGTPSGVGHSREPRLYMKDGDVCEVEIDGIGLLSNPIIREKS